MKMPKLRRAIACATLTAMLLAPGRAQASGTCGGVNMLAALEAARPSAVADMRAAAHAWPNAEGLFWRVDKPGLAPSFLFGTFHATADEGVTIPAPVQNALRGAKAVFTEISAQEQAAMLAAFRQDPDLITDWRGGTLDAALTPELRAIAARILPRHGMTYAQGNMLRPWFMQIALATPPCAIAAMAAGARVLDDQIVDAALGAGLPVRGMETWPDALNHLINQPKDDAREALALTIIFADRIEDMRRTSRDLWRDEQTMLIWELSRHFYALAVGPVAADAALDDMWNCLVVARNAGFVFAASDDLAMGGAFVAVGALHLPGAGGMIERMRAMGYAVTRVPLR